MKGKERADLRSEAHHLTPLVHVGHHGITPSLVETLDDTLRTKELVKVRFGRGAVVERKAVAGELAVATGSEVVQVIGHTVTFYRYNPDLPRKEGDLPPWRR